MLARLSSKLKQMLLLLLPRQYGKLSENRSIGIQTSVINFHWTNDGDSHISKHIEINERILFRSSSLFSNELRRAEDDKEIQLRGDQEFLVFE